MSFGGLILTNAGRNELIKAEMGGTISITHAVLGDGSYNGSYSVISSLVSKVMEIPVTRISRTDEGVLLECDFSSRDVPRGFYLREIGIVANGVLCYYDNSREDAEYIDPESSVVVKQKRMRFILLISSEINVEVRVASSLYALAEDLERVMYPEYTEAAELAVPDKKEVIWGILGKTKKAIRELMNHISDKGNPHESDKDQVGLDKVDNTADIDKPVSTAQQAALDDLYQQLTAYTQAKIAELINGAPTSMDTLKEVSDAIAAHKSVMDALDAAIGKKASSAEFDSHVKDTTAHVTATERNAWNGKQAAITGAASTVTANNLTANRALVSNGSGKLAVSAVTSTELGYLDGVTSNVQTQLNQLNTGLAGKADTGHHHDDRYYTESEVDNKLSGKANSSHHHDDRYYTESEINAKLAGKSDTGHHHDDRYYTESEVDNKLSGKANSSHHHDDRYYTESEINAKLAGMGFSGSTFAAIGYGPSIAGLVDCFGIGNGRYVVLIQGKIHSQIGSIRIWGFNLSTILGSLGLPASLNYLSGRYIAYDASGKLLTDAVGFGTFFAQEVTDGYKILNPARCYSATGATGWWMSTDAPAQPGVFYDATIVVG